MSGCPQAGVLSPLLRCLVVESLLAQLNQMGIYVQSYAEDNTIIVRGKFGWNVFEVLQAALTSVGYYCSQRGLRVSESKTTIVLFTNRR